MARNSVYVLAKEFSPGFWPEAVGSWWDGQNQIDVVAASYQQRIAWLGEARWRNQPMGVADLEILQQKAKVWQESERGWRIYYVLFSRSGFTQPLQDRAKSDAEILLFDPDKVVFQDS